MCREKNWWFTLFYRLHPLILMPLFVTFLVNLLFIFPSDELFKQLSSFLSFCSKSLSPHVIFTRIQINYERSKMRKNKNFRNLSMYHKAAKNIVISLICWCGNFMERHSFPDTVSFHKISTPGNQVQSPYFSQCKVIKQQAHFNCFRII